MLVICYNIPLRLAHKGCRFHCWFGHGVKPEMSWHLHRGFENILACKYLWMKYVILLLNICELHSTNEHYVFVKKLVYIDLYVQHEFEKQETSRTETSPSLPEPKHSGTHRTGHQSFGSRLPRTWCTCRCWRRRLDAMDMEGSQDLFCQLLSVQEYLVYQIAK